MKLGLTEYYDLMVNAKGYATGAILLGGSPRQPTPWASPVSVKPAQAEKTVTVSLRPVQAAFTAMSRPIAEKLPTVLHILVHGSQATDDAIDFSDVDVLVILNDQRVFSHKEHLISLRELKRLLASIYRFDSLMHHGLMFMPSSMLGKYDESFLPTKTLELARFLHGPGVLNICIGPPNRERDLTRLLSATASIRAQLEGKLHLRGDYQLKNLISGVLLLPSLYLAHRGIFVYKRDAFELARPHFSTDEWAFISSAERIRRAWTRPLDSVAKVFFCAFGHPRRQTLVSEFLPSRVNLKKPQVREHVDHLESSAPAFLASLEACR